MQCYVQGGRKQHPCSGHVYWRDSEGKRGGDLFIGGDSSVSVTKVMYRQVVSKCLLQLQCDGRCISARQI